MAQSLRVKYDDGGQSCLCQGKGKCAISSPIIFSTTPIVEVCVSGLPPNFHIPPQECGRNSTIIFASGLLAGYRNTNGSFNNLSTNGNFWSSLPSSANAWNRNLNSGNATVNRNTNDKLNGFSVRCLKDRTPGHRCA